MSAPSSYKIHCASCGEFMWRGFPPDDAYVCVHCRGEAGDDVAKKVAERIDAMTPTCPCCGKKHA